MSSQTLPFEGCAQLSGFRARTALFDSCSLCLFLEEDQSLHQRMGSEILALSLCPADQRSLLASVLASFLEVEVL